MTQSTPNIEKDLTGLKGAIELTDEILRKGGILNPRFHMFIHSDVLARYLSARAGEVFDPNGLDHLFENNIARRRGEFKMVRIPYEDIHDVYRVIARLHSTGDLTGADQLPTTPLKQLSPVSAVNNIVNAWSSDLRTPNHPASDPALREKLEAIANLILHEAHPDSQDLTTPRRRKTDFQISAPLLVHTLDRIRDTPDQQEFAQVCDATDLDFAITKSAVGAYITLVSQHGLTPDVSGLAEMYRRGLLPLSILTKNNGIIENICLLTGREKDELVDAIARVEETHSIQRPALVSTLLEKYEVHLEEVELERKERAEKDAARQKHSPSRNANHVLEKNPPAQTPQREADMDMEVEAHILLRSSAAIAEDSAWVTNALVAGVLGHPDAPLPDLTGFTRSTESLDERFQVDLEPTDVWFTSAFLQGFNNNLKYAQASNKYPALLSMPQDEFSSDSITCYLLAAREIDVFVESMLAHSALRSLLIEKERGPEFKKAIKALGAIVSDLDRLHLNTLESLRDVLNLKSDIANTTRAWRKLLHNPLMKRVPSEGQTVINLDDEQIREASLLYHLPVPVTKAIFANEFVGMAWDLTDEQFQARIAERNSFDATGRVQEVAESIRHSLSTAGLETVVRGYPLKLQIHNPKGFSEYVRPVSKRYDDIFEGDEETFDMIFNARTSKPGAKPIAASISGKPDSPVRVFSPPTR